MAILEKEVWVGLASKNIPYYENKGYDIPRYKNKNGSFSVKTGTKLKVKVKDLLLGCGVKVTKICDDCGDEIPNQSYNIIIKQRNSTDGKDRCFYCGVKYAGQIKKQKIKYEKSAEYYYNNNNLQHLVKLFSNKNSKKLIDVSYGSADIYLWNCPEFGEYHEHEMSMHHKNRKDRGSCPYCSGRRVLKGYNDIWTTNPETAEILWNSEDGYYVSKGSSQRLDFKCSDCGYKIKNKVISCIVKQGLSCPQCSDGVSLPEKFITAMFNQIKIDYETQKNFDWSKNYCHQNPKLCGDKRYDGFLPELGIIVEVHGIQHYEKGFELDKSLDEVIENDVIKCNLANNNFYSVIVIDAKKSEMDYLKNSILNSDLAKILNLDHINWGKCWEFACSSLMKKTWDIWNGGTKKIDDISKILSISNDTVRRYLKKGSKINLCDYDPKVEMVKSARKNGEKTKKAVIRLTLDEVYIDEYESMTKASSILNVNYISISNVCRGKYKTAGGYKWMFKEDYDQYIKQAK